MGVDAAAESIGNFLNDVFKAIIVLVCIAVISIIFNIVQWLNGFSHEKVIEEQRRQEVIEQLTPEQRAVLKIE